MNMKTILSISFTAVLLFLMTASGYGQTAPALGTTAPFALFTAAGALTATGSPTITGNVGSYNSTPTGFPVSSVTGTIYTVGDPALTQPASDVATAYGDFTGGSVLGVGLGNGQTLTPGVYNTGAASTLNGNLTLNGQGDPNALFIIRIGGALAASASTVTLINSASSANVYWQIAGEFDLADGSVFMGNVVADGAIHLYGTSVLHGRALSTAGAISVVSNTVNINSVVGGFATGISSVDATNAVTVTPNPFSTYIAINIKEVSKAHNYRLLLFNVIGTEVMNSMLNQQLTTFSTSNLREGIYLYKVLDNDRVIQSGKLISKQ
jgi:hypothetical protein